VSRRVRLVLVAAAALAFAVVLAPLLPRRSAPLVETPAALRLGESLFRRSCLHCHADIPLARRVAGWTPDRAYAAIGRLPELSTAMPPFRGTDEERRGLAVYVAALGRGAR
jgi:mono/diheme cytochrome c family protein